MEKIYDYITLIKKNTLQPDEIVDNRIQVFAWLSQSIYEGKAPLKINTVDFIIAKILNQKKEIYNFQKKFTFDVYVIGTFRKTFLPTYRVAEAFTDFYLETNILPNIISIPKHLFLKKPKWFIKKFRNGVRIYEKG